MLDLVLLRVEVFFSARRQRRVLAELEYRAVDAVRRPERGEQHEPRDERRTPAELKILGEDILRVRPQVRAAELAHLGLGELGEVLGELLLGVAPRKVVVRLLEAQLGEPVQHLRAREGFR